MQTALAPRSRARPRLRFGVLGINHEHIDNERLLLPVSVKIDELLQAGAIGHVTRMEGVGPHGLFGHGPREPWFWTRAGRGGILTDAGAHQADQFLHYVGGERAEVVRAETGNFENPEHPEFEDYGHVVWRSTAGVGEATVTFYRGPSTTGFLLTLEGSEGRMEVRKHAGRISVLGRSGAKKENTRSIPSFPARSVHVWWTTSSIARKPLSLRNKPSWPANWPCVPNSPRCERAPGLSSSRHGLDERGRPQEHAVGVPAGVAK